MALTLIGCTDAPDEGGGATSATTSTSSAASSAASSSTPTRTVEIDGAGRGLTDAVAKTYGKKSVTGTAKTGRWRSSRVAVVTSDDDVTHAVQPMGKDWQVVGGWWPSLDKDADLGKGGAGLMGFARDLWVPIPGHGHGKLNAAMVYGGPKAEVSAVSSISGIDVDGYVVTGFKGFRAIVDELGPLDFDSPEGLDAHLPGGQIPKGETRLGPHEALAYARERKTLPRGDFRPLPQSGPAAPGRRDPGPRAGPTPCPRRSPSSTSTRAATSRRASAR